MATFQSVRKFRVTSLHFTIIMSVNYEVRIYGNLVQMKLLLCWNIWDIFYNFCLEWNRSPISRCSKKPTNSAVFFGYFKLEPRFGIKIFFLLNSMLDLFLCTWFEYVWYKMIFARKHFQGSQFSVKIDLGTPLLSKSTSFPTSSSRFFQKLRWPNFAFFVFHP